MSDNNFKNTKQIAELLGVSEKTVQRMAKSGMVRSYLFLSEYRFRESEVLEDIEKFRTRPVMASQLRAVSIR